MKALIVAKVIMIAMLFGCLLNMPYAYYQLLRWVVCAGLIFFAHNEYEKNRVYKILPCIFVTILFNPIAPIHLKRETWQPIDITLGCVLIVWVIADIIIALKDGIEKRKESN